MNNQINPSSPEAIENAPRVDINSSEENNLQAGAMILEKINALEVQLLEVVKYLTDPNRQKLNNIHFFRNVLPNDSAMNQKLLMTNWQRVENYNNPLGYRDLINSGFRVFSQNDEDGVILRIFSAVGVKNNFVIEIGSNCAGSQLDIPENLSSNLIINHGWHGLIIERDIAECKRMQYFFAQNPATRHFHMVNDEHVTYYSPHVLCAEVRSDNIHALLPADTVEPDLFVLDIDSIDFRVMESLDYIRPRVIVVEIEKSFRDRFSVILKSPELFNKSMRHSGSTSLLAWMNLLELRGYYLCALSGAGFNAFFIRRDVGDSKIQALTAKQAFDDHPIFSKLPTNFWISPDDAWEEV